MSAGCTKSPGEAATLENRGDVREDHCSLADGYISTNQFHFRESERAKHVVVKKSADDEASSKSKGNRDKSGAVKCPQCDMVFYKQSTMEIHLVSKIHCCFTGTDLG